MRHLAMGLGELLILGACLMLGTRAQENAASSVAKSLMECYNNTENLDRERRPPSSMNVLIELIRKVEFGPSIQNDREISKELLHRFKQDGIIKFINSGNSLYTVPYTPKGMQFDKHKILLKKLIPGNAVNFPNETLTETEKCSLHFMLSNSIDLRPRGDESLVCNKLDRFQRRVRRDLSPKDDVEMLVPSLSKGVKGNLQKKDPEEKPEIVDEPEETEVFRNSPSNSRTTISFDLSDCPLENGVVYTQWEAVQAGSVIAGIAAGRQSQFIPSEENYSIDNRYGSTLAGDLAEVSLYQGAEGKAEFVLGVKGGWNGTQIPRWYFIQKNKDLEITDAEIRGGLDGLIIALNVEEWQKKASMLKISQILDMYYSPRGVFSKKFRACNRQNLYTEVASQGVLTNQTIAVSFLLNDEAKLPGSILAEGIKAYGEKAVNALNNYIPSLSNLKCTLESDTVQRVNTDILIVLDTQWQFSIIQRALAYLLDNLDVNRFDSNFTLINGKDGGIIVNSSNSILDFYSKYNRTVHLNHPTGFDTLRTFNVVELMIKRKMDEAINTLNAGGPSTIVLFVPYVTLSENDKIIADERKLQFKNYLPDVKLLVLGRNSKEAYSELVFDASSDTFGLSDVSTDGTSITDTVNGVISRIKLIHRRIINPRCGSTWSGGSSSESFDQYVEPNSVNYYRASPNYFYGEGSRSIKVKGYGYGNLVSCMSRQDEKPRKNSTEGGDVNCQTISSTNEVSFTLTDACNNYDSARQCPPVYISVEGVGTGNESTNIRCNDNACRFPNDIKYAIQVENFGCASGSYRIVQNIAILIISFYVTITFVL